MQPNFDYFNELARGDEAFLRELKSVLMEEFPQEVQEYNKRLSARDLNGAAALVHKIKHKVGLLGMEADYATVQAYEDDLRQGNQLNTSEFERIVSTIFVFLDIPYNPTS